MTWREPWRAFLRRRNEHLGRDEPLLQLRVLLGMRREGRTDIPQEGDKTGSAINSSPVKDR